MNGETGLQVTTLTFRYRACSRDEVPGILVVAERQKEFQDGQPKDRPAPVE
jgi:hypothetical protein